MRCTILFVVSLLQNGSLVPAVQIREVPIKSELLISFAFLASAGSSFLCIISVFCHPNPLLLPNEINTRVVHLLSIASSCSIGILCCLI